MESEDIEVCLMALAEVFGNRLKLTPGKRIYTALNDAMKKPANRKTKNLKDGYYWTSHSSQSSEIMGSGANDLRPKVERGSTNVGQ